MKRMGLLKSGTILLACLGLLIPGPMLQAATTDTGPQHLADGRVPAVVDVALSDGGTLHGQVVDPQGNPLSRTAVSIQQFDREVATTVTDPSGRFRAAGLRGGMYRIVAGQATGTYRLWAPNTAPASARPAALLIPSGAEVVRGNRGLRLLRNPWVIAGIVAVAIAVPVAIHNADDDDGPHSPP
ncbi:MAG TPA: carboxypeptidase-like regulatory domain-containing protein [Thermoguttaceae bacterium]|nr:carboxypeptidase-like regulatory domain-containing protein [Thermoguttaceae bacterium]